MPVLALTVPPAVAGITFQMPLQNGITINDIPGPTIKSATGALIIVTDPPADLFIFLNPDLCLICTCV